MTYGLFLCLFAALFNSINSLSFSPSKSKRRQFVAGGCSTIVSTCIITTQQPLTVAADSLVDEQKIETLLDASTIAWNGPPWKEARYRSSTLQQSSSNYSPPESNTPPILPTWMEGYHEISYKFKRASFPQGRKILTLRTAGAGLGSCLLLPNIGYNPVRFPIHFIRDSNAQVCEDLAYNVPRIFEAFWPEAKVLGVQTNYITNDNVPNELTSKCLVTGEGCIAPEKRQPSTRVTIEFNGPRRGGGRVTQSADATILNTSYQSNGADTYYTSKSFSQYNVNQDLQLFYREFTSFQRKGNDTVDGKIRVAAFLPQYIRGLDSSNKSGDNYNEYEAVAIYDYNVHLQKIDESEAATF